MGDTALQEALQRKAEIEKELRDINEFIALYKRLFRRGAEGKTGNLFPGVATSESSQVHSSAVKRRGNLPRSEIGRIAKDVILRHGAPMTRGELLEALAKEGVEIVAADRSKSMGTIMWRLREDFANIEGHGYWPRTVPCPAVGYTPERH